MLPDAPIIVAQETTVTYTTMSGANLQYPTSTSYQPPTGFQSQLPHHINQSQPTNTNQPQNIYPDASYQSQPAYNPPIVYRSGPQPAYNHAFQP